MKKSLFLAVATLLSLPAFADGFADLTKTYSPMHVAEARYGFTNITSDVKLSVITYSGVPDQEMTLEYVQNDLETFVTLEIYQTEIDACGSTHYYAKNAVRIKSPAVGYRYNVHLTDHTTRRCRDLPAYKWEANVRSGFGWCGTGDAEMTLVGNP